jgi:hypothetical protein
MRFGGGKGFRRARGMGGFMRTASMRVIVIMPVIVIIHAALLAWAILKISRSEAGKPSSF